MTNILCDKMAIRVVHNICIMQDNNIIFSFPQDTLFGYVPNDLWPAIVKYHESVDYFAIGKSDTEYDNYKKVDMDSNLLHRFKSEYIKNNCVMLMPDLVFPSSYTGIFSVGPNKVLKKHSVGYKNIWYYSWIYFYFTKNLTCEKYGRYQVQLGNNFDKALLINQLDNLLIGECTGTYGYCLFVRQ